MPKNMKGGQGGAAGYAEFVYGKADSQHAVSADSNVIAMNNPAGYAAKGGKRRQKKGGSTFVDLAVPAVLLYAQQSSSKPSKSRKTQGRKSFRKSRRSTRSIRR